MRGNQVSRKVWLFALLFWKSALRSPSPPPRLLLLSFLSYRRFFIGSSLLQFLEDAILRELALQGLDRIFDVVVLNLYLQIDLLEG